MPPRPANPAHVRPCDTKVPTVNRIMNVGANTWRRKETRQQSELVVYRNHEYNVQTRCINRERSEHIPGNLVKTWPRFLKIVDLVTGEWHPPAPATRAQMKDMTRAGWTTLGAYYELPWVPAGPGATTMVQMRRDYKAFIGLSLMG